MATLIYALPVMPGMSERVRRFQEEVELHRPAYDELNRAATVTRHEMYLQESPQRDLAITLMEADDPSRVLRAFTDTPYDSWWRAWNKDVHGFDPADMRPEDFRPGGLVFSDQEAARA